MRILVTLNQQAHELTKGEYPLNALETLLALGNTVSTADWTDLREGRVLRAYNIGERDRYGNALLDEEFDIVHLLQLGDIHDRLPEFRRVVEGLQSFKGQAVNPPDIILSGLTKDYILRLQGQGFPVPQTARYSAEQITDMPSQHSGDKVIKPIDGEKGNLVVRVKELTNEIASQYLQRGNDFLVQEFVGNIRDGERSLIFLNGKFSHAAIKIPHSDYRVNWNFGTDIMSYSPSRQEMNLGYEVHSAWPTTVPVMRIDLVGETDKPLIMEVETVNPSMYGESTGSGANLGQRFHTMYEELSQGHVLDRKS